MPQTYRHGHSIVEALVVTGLITVLLGLLLPAIQRVREAAARLVCQSNLKQLGIAVHHFHNDYKYLPPTPRRRDRKPHPTQHLGWMAQLLPYLEQDGLYASSLSAGQLDPDPLHNPPHVGLATVIKPFVCASDSRLLRPQTDHANLTASFTSYIGINGTLPPGRQRGELGMITGLGLGLADVRDGLSNTIMVGERPPPDTFQAGLWYPYFHGHAIGMRGPNNVLVLGGLVLDPVRDPCALSGIPFGPGVTSNPCDRFHLWSLHPGGANFLFGDGSVRYLTYQARAEVMAMGSISGGEVVELP
jgi:prepilin-type processing-associated H-X9-DG protein